MKFFRIINPNLNETLRQKMQVVFLQHCLNCDSSIFLALSHGKLHANNEYIEYIDSDEKIITNCDLTGNQTGISLAFVLATCGYDVWLDNQRANGVSTGNIHYSQWSNYNKM